MSVIAKLVVRDLKNYGTGRLVELGCIAPNDLMAAYAETESDKLFTKYSPWGEMRLHQSGPILGFDKDSHHYVMVLNQAEVVDETFPGAAGVCRLRVVSVTDFGDNSAKTIEFCDAYEKDGRTAIDHFNWKMAIDNPPAADQFKPSRSDYWMAIYPEKEFSRDEAIAAAHGHVREPADG